MLVIFPCNQIFKLLIWLNSQRHTQAFVEMLAYVDCWWSLGKIFLFGCSLIFKETMLFIRVPKIPYFYSSVTTTILLCDTEEYQIEYQLHCIKRWTIWNYFPKYVYMCANVPFGERSKRNCQIAERERELSHTTRIRNKWNSNYIYVDANPLRTCDYDMTWHLSVKGYLYTYWRCTSDFT